MSNLEQLVLTKGRLIRQHGLLKKTRMITSERSLSDFILSYIDETAKYGLTEEGKRVIGYTRATRDQGIFLKEGIEYLTKEEQGNLKVYGFLRDDLHKHLGEAPHRVPNRKRVEGAYLVYSNRLKKKGITSMGHRFVISIDPRMCEIMAAAHISVDEALEDISRTVLRRFQERFYPDDRLGFMVGIHHDRKHIHAHVVLFPTTEKGKLLAVSDGLRKKGRSYREDRLTFLRETTQTLTKRFYEKEIAKPIQATQRPVDLVAQRKLLGRVAYDNFQKLKMVTDEATKWRWIAKERIRLEGLSDDDLRVVLKNAYEDELVRWEKSKKVMNTKDKQAQGLAALNSDMEECKKRISELKKELKELNKEYKETIKATRGIKADLSSWQRVKAFGASYNLGKFKFCDSKTATWLTNRMSKNDELAALLRNNPLVNLEKENITPPSWVKEKQEKFAVMTGTPIARLAQLRAKYQPNTYKIDFSKMEEDIIRSFLNYEITDTVNIQEKIFERRKEILTELQGINIKSSLSSLDLTHIKSFEYNTPPIYLQQYSGWKLGGKTIPLFARRTGKDTFKAEHHARLSEPDRDKSITDLISKYSMESWELHETLTSAQMSVKLKHTHESITKEAKDKSVEELDKPLQSNAISVFLSKKKDTMVRRSSSTLLTTDIATNIIKQELS